MKFLRWKLRAVFADLASSLIFEKYSHLDLNEDYV